ncbi:MAG: MDR family MFS transporter [Coriobacteriia bacterium]|nr:MDR family MFS transporter [Coriobacteriia bacterium]
MGLTRKQIVMLAVLISGTFVTILNQTLVTPALPTIMSETNVDASTVQWLTTGFTMVSAVMVPITAYLTDRFPVKGLFVVSMSVFTAGTLLCAWGPNFPALLGGRLVQAAAAGVLMPMVMTVMLLTFPVERRGTAMGLFGIIIMFAPALGPTVSGLIIDNANWHILFLLVAALCAIDVLVAAFALPREQKAVPEHLTLDKLSVVLSTFGFGGMLYGFSVIGSSGFSVTAGVAVLAGAIITALFIRRQLHLEVPMLEMRVLKVRNFTVGTVVGMIVQAAILANSVLIPIYVQNLCGQPATVSGLVLLPGAILMGIMGPVAGRIFDKHGPRVLSLVGIIGLTVSTFVMTTLSLETSMVFLGTMIAIRNLCMSLINMPLNTWAMNALDNRYINHGNAVSNTFRQAAGALGTALVISAYSIMAGLQTEALGEVQASLAGINFAFVVQGVLCLAATVIVIFFVKDKKKAPAGAQSPAAAKANPENLASMMREANNVLPAETPVSQVVAFFDANKTDAAILVDSEHRMMGIISDGDILRALTPHAASEYVDPTIILATARQDPDTNHHINTVMSTPAIHLATTNVITINVTDTPREVMHVLGQNHLKKAPVLQDGKLVGVLDRSAINMQALQRFLEEERTTQQD